MSAYVKAALDEASRALTDLRDDEQTIASIADAGGALADCFEREGRVFSCGNGGSMCDAMHFAEELSGRFRGERRGLPASAISDPGHISCVSNDCGYERIFASYVEAHGRAGDVLLAISTSGASENVLAAARSAKQIGMKTVSLTGARQSALGALADRDICTPAGEYADRVQELHIKVIHILIELVERRLFPQNYEQ